MEQSAKHYRLSDGTVLAAQYGMDVHYEDEDGAWEEMRNLYCAKAVLRLKDQNVYPWFEVLYRDTKGIEDYYTYQTHDIGNAGTAYVSDYNGQLTMIRQIAAYDSTVMSYDLSLVYNSSFRDKYFINDGNDIHSKNFSNMKLGHGWKLSAQETVTEIELANMNEQTVWLVYNDSDGTEHYFKESEEIYQWISDKSDRCQWKFHSHCIQ